MPENRLDRTARALREAADLLEALPAGPLRLEVPLFGGPLVNPAHLRRQADHLESVREAVVLAELDTETDPDGS